MVYLPHFDAAEWVRLVARRGCHDGDRGADDAGPHRHRARAAAGRAADAAQPGLRRVEGRTSVGAQGTRTAARRRLRQRLRPDRDQLHHRGARLPTTTAPRSASPTTRSLGGSVRSVSRCPASRCRSATTTARSSGPARPASSTSAASRCPAGTPGSDPCSTPRAGSPPRTSRCSTTEGYLFIGGRSDDTIIRGGENIAPAEIEDVLVEHPQRARLRGRRGRGPAVGPDHRRGRGSRRGADPDADELREHVRAQLRGSRTPDRVVFRDELPTNATGKVLRRELIARIHSSESIRSRT